MYSEQYIRGVLGARILLARTFVTSAGRRRPEWLYSESHQRLP
jgi:hypothetical protein